MAQRLDATYSPMSRWSKAWGWVEIGEDGMSHIRDRDRTCLRPLTLRIIVPAPYALHQPDIPLCVLPGPPLPRPHNDHTLYGRLRGESRCLPWCPTPHTRSSLLHRAK